MTGILIRENLDADMYKARTQRDPAPSQGVPEATSSWERGLGPVLPHGGQKEPTLLAS